MLMSSWIQLPSHGSHFPSLSLLSLLWGHLSDEEQGHLQFFLKDCPLLCPLPARHSHRQVLENLPSNSLMNPSASPHPHGCHPMEATIFSLSDDGNGLPQTILAPTVHVPHNNPAPQQLTPRPKSSASFSGHMGSTPCPLASPTLICPSPTLTPESPSISPSEVFSSLSYLSMHTCPLSPKSHTILR